MRLHEICTELKPDDEFDLVSNGNYGNGSRGTYRVTSRWSNTDERLVAEALTGDSAGRSKYVYGDAKIENVQFKRKSSSTTTSSTGDLMFNTKTVDVVDGYIGQVIASINGKQVIVWQGESHAEEIDTETGIDTGKLDAEKDAKNKIADVVKNLFA